MGNVNDDPFWAAIEPSIKCYSRAVATLLGQRDDLLAALEKIEQYEYRADRRKRGMVDVFELESLQAIARAAIAKATA